MRERLALVCLLAATLTGGTTVAQAAPPPALTGSGNWEADMTLPEYPCPTGSCTFAFTGDFEGTVNVVNSVGATVYTAVFTGPNDMSAGPGNHSEDCLISGQATAPFTVTGLLEQGSTVVGTAKLVGSFFWSTTAGAGTISYWPVSLQNGSGTVLGSAGTVGQGTLTEGPAVPVNPSQGVPSCGNEIPVTMAVSGSYAQPF